MDESKEIVSNTKEEQQDANWGREYIVLNRQEDETPSESEIGKMRTDYSELDRYQYFDGEAVRKSMHLLHSISRNGEELLNRGMVRLRNLETGYTDSHTEMIAEAFGDGREGKKEFPLHIVFNRNKVLYAECNCSHCMKHYYYLYYRREYCAYLSAFMTLVEEYLQGKNLGDATDKSAMLMMQAFMEQYANNVISDTAGKRENLILQPRLTLRNGDMTVSFKVGDGKMFVVKNLFEFYGNVQESRTTVYGSNTEINHNLKNFAHPCRKWIDYIGRIVREEQAFERRLIESGSYSRRAVSKNGELALYGWRLDELYDLLGTDTIELEDKDAGGKYTLHMEEKNPRISMTIRKNDISSRRVFHGITVECKIPPLYYGVRTAYYISQDALCRLQEEFERRIRVLAELGENGSATFQVGRNSLSQFYHNVLPQLEGVVDILKENEEEIEVYLMPKAEFVFYLDAEAGNMSCRVEARYGDRQISVLDQMAEEGIRERFRDVMKEQEILYLTMQWFPDYDPKERVLHCGGDEELMYQVLDRGVDVLLALGEVQCTRRFSGMHINRRVRVSVGVSVSRNLLDLNISTEDIPPGELLDILKSYRLRKKYHRLRNGDFLSLEDDSLETLQEMMDTLRISPKELLKENIRLPLYRALYLDRLLEKNEEIYAVRDSYFRELVKDFKAVKDADFEVPETLSKVLRGYQTTGYRWLRTLDAWKFGGILADDMGLGKTLQAIAVLLALKQEGKKRTSLVVAPASLVYNWGEELRRFAPELSCEIIAGTQEERIQKLEAYGAFDVIVTSYDLLKRDIAEYEGKEFLCQIIDEAQYIKNHTTAASKAVKGIKSRTRYALTGTPVENRLSELWSIFDYLMPGYLYGYEVFKKEFEAPIVRKEEQSALKRLQRMTAPFILRRLKEDVLKDLPEKLEESRYVKFETAQRQLYDAQVVHMRQTYFAQGAEEFQRNKIQILAELMKLRQICCDPGLCFEDYEGGSAKLEACLELVQNAVEGGHRILLFSQFTSMLDIIAGRLRQAGLSFYTITGATPKEKRLQLVKEFNEGDVPVFLISLKAGGVGLNLTGADVVIHYDPWWNLAVQNQATDRSHRIGQTKKVVVYKLIATETIEKKIQELQESKRLLSEQIVQGDAGQLSTMSREDFLELLS
ncbi:MAG: SNF2 helicase associated domain-containing protein [Acetatifactor sp.]|nr:SNF2 helicase associated domain-containing protein [Acetatifactor sp.]